MDKRKRSRMEEKKKAPKDTPSSDSDNGPPEVLPSSRKHFMYQQMAAKNKNMPTCPSFETMYRWTVKEYEDYDNFLIAKWYRVGCDENEAVYARTKDPNGKIARAYMAWWNRKKNKH